MSDYGDEEESILKSMDAMNKAMVPFAISMAEIDFFGIAVGKYLAVGMFPGFALLFLYFAYIAQLHSYWNLLFLELSSGFFFFAAAPTVIHLGKQYRWQVPSAGLLLAAPLLLTAYHSEKLLPLLSHHATEFLQAALIEYSIALLLMVGLEIAMVPWLESINTKYQQALADLSQLKQEVNNPIVSPNN